MKGSCALQSTWVGLTGIAVDMQFIISIKCHAHSLHCSALEGSKTAMLVARKFTSNAGSINLM